MDCSEVSSVVLDSTQRSPADLTRGVDPVYWFMLGQAPLIPKLFTTRLTRKYISAFLQWVGIVKVLPET